MKKAIVAIILLSGFYTSAFCQDYLKAPFGIWIPAYYSGGFRAISVDISFSLAKCIAIEGVKTTEGYSYWRIRNLKFRERASVEFKFEYKDCSEQIKTENVHVDLTKTGVDEGIGFHFIGHEFLRVTDIVVHDPIFDLALSLKDKIDILAGQLNDKYIKAKLRLPYVKDVKLRSQYELAFLDEHSKTDAAYQEGLKFYRWREGERMQEQMDAMQKYGDELDKNAALMEDVIAKQPHGSTDQNLAKDLNEPGNGQSKNTNNNNQNKQFNSVGSGGQSNAGNTNNANSQQTQAYINQAQNTTNDGIQKQLAINKAATNSLTQGGATQAQKQQIQQLQADQTNEMITKTADAVGNLINVLTKPKDTAPKETEAEMNARIKKEVQTDAEKHGDVFDANGKLVSTTETRALQAYDDAHAEQYKANYANLGKYQQKQKIYLTRALLKQWETNTSQKETMDIIASNIWKYAKTPTQRPTGNNNMIDEIAFVDSVFTYKGYEQFGADMVAKNEKIMIQSKIDLSKTPITYFEITPGDDTAHDDLYLTVGTTNPKESLSFHLSVDAVAPDIPTVIMKSFVHLVLLCHGQIITSN